ncbi:unnamed protein product [Urochloa decumbens]|uniref:Leucine-rich repeat-containing N-terminal plant-type domain-containing protein n=1 Tax=Urochloa decumbens TaxID=240449 RepID=A0ABC8YYC0_9POAL
MATTMAHHGPPTVVLHLLIKIHLALVLCSLLPTSVGAFTSNHTLVPCLANQASALLRLKRSFTTTNYSIIAFRSWRAGTDCCSWVGVRCHDADGRVTSLDLGDRRLESRGLDPALFDMTSLQYVNLAYNDFNMSQLPPKGFERLTMLTYLNLSSSRFSGSVPTGISSLTNLISLDLSTGFEYTELPPVGHILWGEVPTFNSISLAGLNFEALMDKLNNLRELHLGMVDLSNTGTQWCIVVAKSCPKLRVLSLPNCQLSGPICSSLSGLHSLVVINLQFNHLSGQVPEFFTDFSNLTVLQLNRNNFQGQISSAILEHKKLVTINLHHNDRLSGFLPNFSTSSSLVNLNIGRTRFSGVIPNSIGNLVSLKKLGLGANGFYGQIPSSIGNLKSLSELEISGKGIVGSIPSWITNLTSLTTLQFYGCGLSGSLPYFLGDFKYLNNLALCNCNFSGHIPSYISNLTQMQIRLLSSNKFSGTVELTTFRKLPNLIALDLSHNNLVVIDGEFNSSLASLPKIVHLSLSWCNISQFPDFLRHQDEIKFIDLSYNRIGGAIPQWAWETWTSLYYLALANNKFTSVGHAPFLPLPIDILDLSNNMFEGAYQYLKALQYAYGNNLTGKIPLSFCDVTSIQLLDLSYNNFSGPIPSCLMEGAGGMLSLNLKENMLRGEFPDNIKESCSFEALDFSGNLIEERLPRSLISCKHLEVLDVGNNQISDSFLCWMSTLDKLEVLVLKSNKFFGQVVPSLPEEKSACAFPSAIIVDISSNNFYGPLPRDRWFKKLKSMIFRDPNSSLIMDHGVPNVGGSYKYTTAITYKGHDTTFSKILTTLVFLDFSNNAFHGSIPKAIGELGLLHGLNMSHNSLIGPIPPQLGHLNQLEALDLSCNELSGEIPQELAPLDFLTILNLSDNRLVGSIPVSPHFLTFSNSSFLGNDGLCGPPLSKQCINTTTLNVVPHHPKKNSVDIILVLLVGLGFGVGFATSIVVAWGIPVKKRSS